jgi:hypothetical protein
MTKSAKARRRRRTRKRSRSVAAVERSELRGRSLLLAWPCFDPKCLLHGPQDFSL